MASAEHLAILRTGVKAWNQWRRTNPYVYVDLREANLPEHDFNKIDFHKVNLGNASLADTYLREAILSDASMNGAQLDDADLTQANLARARMIGASLRKTQLHSADLRNADLSHTDLTDADFSGAKLAGAKLYGATLLGTNFEGANLSGCSVYGVSTWDLRLNGATQSNLIITPPLESPIEVDNLEVAQFIYLLLHSAKIRGVIDTIGKKAVLILGRFTVERKQVLDSIRDRLRQHGYLPILFDFEGPGTRDTHETIVTLASMSRFIIADITDPVSIPQELGSIVPNLPSVPVQPILQAGYKPWGMYDHIRRYPWVLPLVEYLNENALLADLQTKVIEPAEDQAKRQLPK